MQNDARFCALTKITEKRITVGVKAPPLDADVEERFFSFGTTGLSRKGETASVVVVVGFFLSMFVFKSKSLRCVKERFCGENFAHQEKKNGFPYKFT